MAIEGHAIGLPGGGGSLVGRTDTSVPDFHGITDDVIEVAEAVVEALKAVVTDAAQVVGKGGGTIGIASVVKSPVDVQSVLVDEVKKILPGSKLDGDWKVPQVSQMIAILQELPKPLLPLFHGITFVLVPWTAVIQRTAANAADGGDDEEKRRALIAIAARREIRIREEAFGLPEIGGVPGMKLALVAELGKIAAAKPGNGSMQAFAKLSGWTETVRTPGGQLVEPPRASTGVVPGEGKNPAPGAPKKGFGPAVPTWSAGAVATPRGGDRPAGTQRLQPQETGRLRAGEDARRAPGTGMLPAGVLPFQAPGRASGPQGAKGVGEISPGRQGQPASDVRGLAAAPGALEGGAFEALAGEDGSAVAREPAGFEATSVEPGQAGAQPASGGRALAQAGTDAPNATPSRGAAAPTRGAAPLTHGATAAPGTPGFGATSTPGTPGFGATSAPATPGLGATSVPGTRHGEPAAPGVPSVRSLQTNRGAGPLAPDAAGLPSRGPSALSRGEQPAGPTRGDLLAGGPRGAGASAGGAPSGGVRGLASSPTRGEAGSSPAGSSPAGFSPAGSGALTPGGPRTASAGLRGSQPLAAQTDPLRAIPVDGGSQVKLKDQNVLAFHHDADPAAVGHAHDPRADFGESLKSFMYKPEGLLAKAPGKFLFLNAETRQYSQAQVQSMAKAAGLDLGAVVTDMLVGGRASQATVNRICEAHGLAADATALRAKDQQTLARGANLEGLTARLALDLGANGPATAKAVREAELLLQAYDKVASKLPLTRDPSRVGLPVGTGVFAWIATRAAQLGEGRTSRVAAELGEIRAAFQRLPLAAQLKVDPKLALGAGFFRLSPAERALLGSPAGVQGLVARAGERVDEVGYIPQRLNASEKRALATQTVIETLFDPGAAGQTLRAKLGWVEGKPVPGASQKPQDPAAALKELTARNGDAVFGLLGDDQKKALGDRKALAALKEALADPALAAAVATLRHDATGAEQLRTAVLRVALDAGKQQGDLLGAIQGAIVSIRAEQARFTKALDGGALELALTEVNRQVQEGNIEFVQRFVADRPDALEEALGPWVTLGLSPAEKKLLEDPDYRRHLVADAKTLRATGASLAEEARQFRVETENLQQTLDFLTRPDQAFRREFEKDPVGALQKRGIYQHLPDPVKLMMTETDRHTQLQQLTKAVEQAIAPIIQRQLGHQKQLENLRAAIKTVNAGNYKPILGVLDLGEAEMNRAVKATLGSAMSAGDRELKTGIVDFL